LRVPRRLAALSALLIGLLSAGLLAASVPGAHADSISAKRAQAQGALAKLQQLDAAAQRATSRYQAASQKLRLVEHRLRVNHQALGVARDNRGFLRVNERFETSVPDVYAVGDVANFNDPLFGRRRIEHWSNANYQGTEVGKILAGEDGGYDIVSNFFTEFFGLTMKVFGDIEPADDLVIRGSLRDRDLIGFYLQEGALVATVVVGQEDETEDKLKELIRAKAVPPDAETLADASVPIPDVF
jgi:hypothetical protein